MIRQLFKVPPYAPPSLEDYGLSPEESRQAKEVEELPFVLNYIEKNNLEAVARRAAAAAGGEDKKGRSI